MDHGESGQTSCCVRTAAGDIDVRISHSADRDMGVPETDVARFGACHIDLKDDCARGNVRDGETHILDLCHAGLSRLTNHYDRSRIVFVPKKAADSLFPLRKELNLMEDRSYLR